MPIILADAIAVAFVAGGYGIVVSSRDCECEEMGSVYLFLFGLSAYIAPVIIHRDKDNTDSAILSGTARVALPAAAGLIARVITEDRSTIVGSVLAGVAGAMVLDWLVLARPARRGGARVTAMGAPIQGGATIGLAGSW